MIKLKTERLEVEMASPGRKYRGSRFDWTAFITQVRLDGRHTFCTVESLDLKQGTGGQGFCNEFGIETPVGFDDAAPGELFPKIGVGLLKRPDTEGYSFMRPYEIIPFSIQVKAEPQSVRFEVEPMPCRGYAFRLIKTVTIAGTQLQIKYSLRNEGTKTIRTEEYVHNFVAIDGQAYGPNYLFTPGFPLSMESPSPALRKQGNSFTWPGYYLRQPLAATPTIVRWELTHTGQGVGMRSCDDFPCSLFAMWGQGHVASPESYLAINLTPGGQLDWCRTWEFFTVK